MFSKSYQRCCRDGGPPFNRNKSFSPYLFSILMLSSKINNFVIDFSIIFKKKEKNNREISNGVANFP